MVSKISMSTAPCRTASYDASFLTKDVTASDLSGGQQQDCEDGIKVGLDNEVECDASDS